MCAAVIKFTVIVPENFQMSRLIASVITFATESIGLLCDGFNALVCTWFKSVGSLSNENVESWHEWRTESQSFSFGVVDLSVPSHKPADFRVKSGNPRTKVFSSWSFLRLMLGENLYSAEWIMTNASLTDRFKIEYFSCPLNMDLCCLYSWLQTTYRTWRLIFILPTLFFWWKEHLLSYVNVLVEDKRLNKSHWISAVIARGLRYYMQYSSTINYSKLSYSTLTDFVCSFLGTNYEIHTPHHGTDSLCTGRRRGAFLRRDWGNSCNRCRMFIKCPQVSIW